MQVQKRIKRGETYQLILKILGVVGVASIAVLAPNALQAISMLQGGGKRRSLYYLTSVLGRMESRGFVAIHKEGENGVVSITEKGKRELDRYRFHEKSLEKKRWDKKWRIVIYDIPEDKRGVRDLFRRRLKEWGFKKWQQSTWITKKDVTEKLRKLVKKLGITNWVAIIESADPAISNIIDTAV